MGNLKKHVLLFILKKSHPQPDFRMCLCSENSSLRRCLLGSPKVIEASAVRFQAFRRWTGAPAFKELEGMISGHSMEYEISRTGSHFRPPKPTIFWGPKKKHVPCFRCFLHFDQIWPDISRSWRFFPFLVGWNQKNSRERWSAWVFSIVAVFYWHALVIGFTNYQWIIHPKWIILWLRSVWKIWWVLTNGKPSGIHRKNAGTLGMVPLIINPMYTWKKWVFIGISPFKGLLGGLNSLFSYEACVLLHVIWLSRFIGPLCSQRSPWVFSEKKNLWGQLLSKQHGFVSDGMRLANDWWHQVGPYVCIDVYSYMQ